MLPLVALLGAGGMAGAMAGAGLHLKQDFQRMDDAKAVPGLVDAMGGDVKRAAAALVNYRLGTQQGQVIADATVVDSLLNPEKYLNAETVNMSAVPMISGGGYAASGAAGAAEVAGVAAGGGWWPVLLLAGLWWLKRSKR